MRIPQAGKKIIRKIGRDAIA